MKKRSRGLFFAGLLLPEAGVLPAGVALALPKWRAFACVPVCAAARADWLRNPRGRRQETARTGFQSAVPTLWVALTVTGFFAYLLAAAD